MRLSDIYFLMPLLILVGATTLNMLIVAVKRNHKIIFGITIAAHLIAILTLLQLEGASWQVRPFL